MIKSEIVHRIESCFPRGVVNAYRNTKRYFFWKYQQVVYSRAIMKVREKRFPINVVFIVNDSAIWKYDSLYWFMQRDSRFNPIILVHQAGIYLTEEEGQSVFQRTFDTFYEKGYNVVKAVNPNCCSQGVSIDALGPDIVFYSYSWAVYNDPQLNAHHLRKYLKCYVNYGFSNTKGEWGYASAFQGLMWRYFVECEDIRSLAIQSRPCEMRNAVVTGYPIYDEYQTAKGEESIWKNKDLKFKRVIWAPHHTIDGHDGLLKFSTFLEFAEQMLSLAEEYKDFVQFVFKPHPLLKEVLSSHPNWGKKKTEVYYSRWAKGENTALETGPYIELFKSSDALIHDCGSFIVEYLYTKKPVMYLGHRREDQSNIVGQKAYDCHYHGNNIEDIKWFLDYVILGEKDRMKNKRIQFYNDVLLPPNGCSVAENIINEIKKELRK